MMKYRNVSLVGSSLFCLACLGLPGCGSNDPTTLVGGGGSSGASNPAVGGLGGAATTGGSSTSSTTTTSNTGGSSTSSSVGGASSVGGTSQSSNTSTGGSTTTTSAGGTSSSQGGSATGGSSTTSSGGAGVGGTSKGGSSAGGASTGGAAQGGNSAGGASAGGASAGGTSAAGTTGTSGATSKPVTPTKVSDTDYSFTMTDCKVVMNVNPKIGSRVSKLTYGGSTNVIVPFTCASYDGSAACNSAGSTFWTSPQSAWDPNSTNDWPPPTEIDGGAYTPAITGTHLVTTGSANSTLGASVTKDFSADDGTCWVTVLYTIKATKAIQVAPWSITRVPRGGLAFFPQGSKTDAGPLAGNVTTSTSTTPSTVWFNDSSKSLSGTNGSKLIADGAGGWLAYAFNGNLFIKKYADVPAASIATGEGDVEIYADATGGFIELEVQGPATSLAANATLPWTVQWRVVPIPSTVTVAAGNAGLLAFVTEQVAK